MGLGAFRSGLRIARWELRVLIHIKFGQTPVHSQSCVTYQTAPPGILFYGNNSKEEQSCICKVLLNNIPLRMGNWPQPSQLKNT